MLIFKLVKLLKFTSCVRPIKHFSTTLNEKPSFYHQNEDKLLIKNNSYQKDKHNICINSGLSSSTIRNNDWIYNMNISKLHFSE